LYGLEALQLAIDYYHGALIHIPPGSRGKTHLALGRCYHELCCYEWKQETAQCSVEHYECARECSVDSKQWTEATNGKAYVLLVLGSEETDDKYKKHTLPQFIDSVMKSSSDPATRATYGTLSHFWPMEGLPSKWGDFSLLAGSTLWFSRSSQWNIPCIVHLMAVAEVARDIQHQGPARPAARDIIDYINHLEVFFERADWKDLVLCARYSFQPNARMTVVEMWKQFYSMVLNRFQETLYKQPSFLNAGKFPTNGEVARVESLIEEKSKKPIPRRKLL
jgi:hypothetical protein